MPAGNTYESIASITLSNDAASVDFGSIPQTYTDLVLVSNAAIVHSAAGTMRINFNSDTGSNYSFTRIYGSGTTAASDRDSNLTWTGVAIIGYSAIASAGTYITNIMNYSNTTTNKTVISRGSDAATGGYVSMYASLWRSTAAINQITISSSQNLRSGSTFSLYGIKAA